MKKRTQNQKSEKNSRGGARPGAGRKSLDRIRPNWTLPSALVDAVRDRAARDGKLESHVAAELLSAALGIG